MILSDVDIKRELGSGVLVIDPIEDADTQIQPASVDLRLGTEFMLLERTGDRIDPERPNSMQYRRVDPELGHRFGLWPGWFVLATTIERVQIPDYLVGRVDGKSSLGRLGLTIHSTAGFIDPGFRGQITLEMSNATASTILLRPGMRIAQMSLERLESAAERPYGHPDRHSKYQDQKGVVGQRVFDRRQPV